ncbi:hypothetical protein [Sphingomonas albertensis]|uniref:Flap endonuclease-1-like 5' DNA nuclease n=1 Tax=Sphingomonas albertensis TaxID=2762591 RepID=A0ABR7AQV5_9SPHN|nr:hypothetical protein [Sphingomonas albertensis]MBC3942821.1 hypothetical protein [Sphingomonas albertensis]
MNETSATSASGMSLLPDGIATLTAIHFTIIAAVAVLVVIGLIWGIKAKRSRVKASRDVIANAKEAGVAPVPVESPRAPAPEPASVAPAPAEAHGAEPRRAEQSQTQTRTVAPTPAPSPSPSPTIERTAPPAAPQPPVIDEPAPAPTPLAPSPAPEPAAPAPAEPAPIAPPVSAQSYADGPVTQLKGLGPKVATQLGVLGVTTVGQMAALSESEAQSIDAQLGIFTGRMGRDRWIEQARLLAAGDKAGFEAVFGKL